jgi:hypothetical protein
MAGIASGFKGNVDMLFQALLESPHSGRLRRPAFQNASVAAR